MEILKEIPNSVLWLMKLNDIAENNLINEAIKLGVDKKRIIFAKRLSSIDEHLARYKLANIFLDTFPYNGHTTVSDALLSGLNVITISGNTFSSRVASSLLNEYRTNKTIATSIEDYKKIALMAIANNCKILINEQRKYTSIDKILEYL